MYNLLFRKHLTVSIENLRHEDGRRLLHGALAFPVEELVLHEGILAETPRVGIVKHIIDGNLTALDEADPITGLFPSMLAAASCEDASFPVDITFELLRRNPAVIKNVLAKG